MRNDAGASPGWHGRQAWGPNARSYYLFQVWAEVSARALPRAASARLSETLYGEDQTAHAGMRGKRGALPILATTNKCEVWPFSVP
jgi:hypothetical protein